MDKDKDFNMRAHAEKSKIKVVAIVRNKHGQVQFDDYDNIPECFRPSLTDEDWEYIKTRRAK